METGFAEQTNAHIKFVREKWRPVFPKRQTTISAPRLTEDFLTMYALFLRDHEVMARIGIHAFERAGAQRLRVNVTLVLKGEPGADTIDAVTDYDFLRESLAEILVAQHYDLQETVCQRLLAAIQAKTDVIAAKVSTEKPDVYPDAAAVGCRIFWIRSGSPMESVLALMT